MNINQYKAIMINLKSNKHLYDKACKLYISNTIELLSIHNELFNI